MERYFFYTSNQGRGHKYPIVKNEQGDVMVYDRKTIKPLPQFKDRLLRDNLISGKEQIDRFIEKCVEVKVNSIGELCGWLDKYDNLVSKKREAEESLRDADNNLFKILKEETNMYPDKLGMQKKSYAETKAMGCTDIVYWDGEPQTNPETGNEFFTPDDARSLFTQLKEKHADDIEDEFDEVWTASNYIWEKADLLEDLIWQEENGLFQE